jgi:hypothetical protein
MERVQKLKFGVRSFKVDARIAYILEFKNLNFFNLKNKIILISKVALVECEWLIFKLHFGLNNEL